MIKLKDILEDIEESFPGIGDAGLGYSNKEAQKFSW